MDTRIRLLDHAEQHIRRRGVDGFSFADLARDVGIRKASIHHHFPTKLALLEALARRLRAASGTRLQAINAGFPRAADRLGAFLEWQANQCDEARAICPFLAMTSDRESLDAASIGQINRYYRDLHLWLAEVYRLGRVDGSLAVPPDPSDAALTLLTRVQGAMMLARAGGTMSLFHRALADLFAP